MNPLNGHEPEPPAINVRVRGGALMFGMKATRLPNLSTYVTLEDESGRFTLKLPLPDFDWVEHGSVLFITLGVVQPFIEGLGGPSDVTRTTEGGLILPRN